MVGDVVGGYEVKEALGSGRNGLLFLAAQPTGHRAVVRRRLGDDDVDQFAREVVQALQLPTPPMVERRKSRAGVAVLLAIVDPDAPGSGYTDHTNTVPLSQVTPRSSPNRFVQVALVSIVAASAGLAGVFAFLSSRRAAAPVSPLAARINKTDTPALEPRALPVQVAVDAGGQPPPGLDVKATRRPPAPPERTGACTPDDEWKKGRYADVQDLFALAAKTDALSSAWERPLTNLEREIHRATTPRDCAAIEATLRRSVKQLSDSP